MARLRRQMLSLALVRAMLVASPASAQVSLPNPGAFAKATKALENKLVPIVKDSAKSAEVSTDKIKQDAAAVENNLASVGKDAANSATESAADELKKNVEEIAGSMVTHDVLASKVAHEEKADHETATDPPKTFAEAAAAAAAAVARNESKSKLAAAVAAKVKEIAESMAAPDSPASKVAHEEKALPKAFREAQAAAAAAESAAEAAVTQRESKGKLAAAAAAHVKDIAESLHDSPASATDLSKTFSEAQVAAAAADSVAEAAVANEESKSKLAAAAAARLVDVVESTVTHDSPFSATDIPNAFAEAQAAAVAAESSAEAAVTLEESLGKRAAAAAVHVEEIAKSMNDLPKTFVEAQEGSLAADSAAHAAGMEADRKGTLAAAAAAHVKDIAKSMAAHDSPASATDLSKSFAEAQAAAAAAQSAAEAAVTQKESKEKVAAAAAVRVKEIAESMNDLPNNFAQAQATAAAAESADKAAISREESKGKLAAAAASHVKEIAESMVDEEKANHGTAINLPKSLEQEQAAAMAAESAFEEQSRHASAAAIAALAAAAAAEKEAQDTVNRVPSYLLKRIKDEQLRDEAKLKETVLAKQTLGDCLGAVDPAVLVSDYMYAEYSFILDRKDMHRQGMGQLWLSFKDDKPRMRIHGSARSAKFGEGQITIVIDSVTQSMYALFRLTEMHKEQCVKYAFPVTDHDSRLERLKWRFQQVCDWRKRQEEHDDKVAAGERSRWVVEHEKAGIKTLLPLNWTTSLDLELMVASDGLHGNVGVHGVNLVRRKVQLPFATNTPEHGRPTTSMSTTLAPGMKPKNDPYDDEIGKIVKSVVLHGVQADKHTVPEDAEHFFAAPSSVCEEGESEELAHLKLHPPHRRSSALMDLLLLLSVKRSHSSFERLFLLLSSITVPGDVAVMIEDPEPPSPKEISKVAFDYQSTVFSLGRNMQFSDPAANMQSSDPAAPQYLEHMSFGSIWFDLDKRAFRLKGETKETKVGPLLVDIIAHGVLDRGIYVNVNLTVQKEQQCIAYDYSSVDPDDGAWAPADKSPDAVATTKMFDELVQLSDLKLFFLAVGELRGEDCSIFVAPLPRGRSIHIWVDMERPRLDAILRSDIHKDGRILRRTDILRWRTHTEVDIAVLPPERWDCRENPAYKQIAHLGLREAHQRSFELQDALYALRYLRPNFAALELLALTGDVAMMVQEPELPAFWELPACSLHFSLYSSGKDKYQDPEVWEDPVIPAPFTTGSFASAERGDVVRISVHRQPSEGTIILLALQKGVLSVRVEERQQEPRCLSVEIRNSADHFANPTQESTKSTAMKNKMLRVPAAVFMGVEEIKGMECNRFRIDGEAGPRFESMELWYAPQEQEICQIKVLPPADDTEGGAGAATIYLPLWQLGWSPGKGDLKHANELAQGPSAWNCTRVNLSSPALWMGMLDQSSMMLHQNALPASSDLAKLGEAFGRVGLLPPAAAQTLSHLVVASPSVVLAKLPRPTPAPTPAPVSIFSENLKTFSFSFASSRKSVDHGSLRHRDGGRGELRVDLASQQLYLRSEGSFSSGLPQVESRVILRGDRGRLFARTRIESQDWEQCWSVKTTEAEGTAQGLKTVRPNPFLRARLAGSGPFLAGKSATNVRDSDEPEMQKFIIRLSHTKYAELIVKDRMELFGINFDDLNRQATSQVAVYNWSTAPLDSGWFEPSNEWKCQDLQFLESSDQLEAWDLLRVFFPPPEAVEIGRRLFEI